MPINKEYLKMQKKYSLPAWKDVDHVFEVSHLDKSTHILRDIRRRVTEKMDHYVKILEGIINPETTISGLHECKYFNDDEKKQLFDLYRKLMAHMRQADMLTVLLDDKEEAVYINSLYKEWPSLQKELKAMLGKLKKCWVEEEVSDQEKIGYFG
jgi:hypothetical protein